MKTNWKVAVAAVVVLATTASASALASPHGHHRHWHGPRVGVGLAFGPVWSPWYYPPPVYYPSYTVVERVAPPVYVEQTAPAGTDAAPAYWYFCRATKAYYPYVKDCPAGWERVAPQPEQR